MKKAVNFVSEYFIYFILYALIGWLYEVFLEVVVYGWGFSNRGVLFGPYLPVYGVGALIFIIGFYRIIKGKSFKKKLILIPVIFLLCMLSATILELITSYICELFTGSWPWQTYSSYKYNFEARIALSPSIRFGIGGLIFLYLLQPAFERLANNIINSKYKFILLMMAFIFIIDFIFSVLI